MPAPASSSQPTARRRAAPDPYKGAPALAWRNAMVAALNAGLDQGLFGLEPGANHWAGEETAEGKDGEARRAGALFRFVFATDVPALAFVGEDGFDDLALHVALWPTPDAERWIHCANARRLAGEVFAQGSLERWEGAYLRPSPESFAGRQERVAAVAATPVEPTGGRFSDRTRAMP